MALAEEYVDSIFEDNADILWSAFNLEGTISRCGRIVITEPIKSYSHISKILIFVNLQCIVRPSNVILLSRVKLFVISLEPKIVKKVLVNPC